MIDRRVGDLAMFKVIFSSFSFFFLGIEKKVGFLSNGLHATRVGEASVAAVAASVAAVAAVCTPRALAASACSWLFFPLFGQGSLGWVCAHALLYVWMCV